MSAVICVNDLSKRFRIGAARTGRFQYRTLRESVTDSVVAVGRRVGRLFRRRGCAETGEPGEFWALKNVSFRVEPGEVLGVVGANGAGKSTLLKVLSRITRPSAGEVRLRGRVGSLLEVGTGFHPELTGRENIFLNGSILGMTHREVQRKFDQIVEFAEIGEFLDTSVKRYSSGMYTRLAFAVASHLEPEILVVDEVLAVGDAQFQQKCLGKMGQVSRSGRTILFVSHSMTAIKALCTRAVLLEKGRVTLNGDVDEVVNRYLSAGTDMASTGVIPEDAPRHSDAPDEALFRSVRVTDLSGEPVTQLYFGQPFQVVFVCDVLRDIPDAHYEVSISTRDGTHVTYATTMDGGSSARRLTPGRHKLTATFEGLTLLPRQYTIDLGIHHQNGTTADYVQRVYNFTVLRVAEEGNDHYPWPRTRGLVRVPVRWSGLDG
ncbi:MAG: ABC transporter ATP-binding protein [Planctomycetia bacterium]|nr:ABC transporter ATP-binding protein [Planctomycetia bacterium]